MYRATIETTILDNKRTEYEILITKDLDAAKRAVNNWLKPHGLRVYQWDDLWVGIGMPIVGYIQGDGDKQSIAWIKVS